MAEGSVLGITCSVQMSASGTEDVQDGSMVTDMPTSLRVVDEGSGNLVGQHVAAQEGSPVHAGGVSHPAPAPSQLSTSPGDEPTAGSSRDVAHASTSLATNAAVSVPVAASSSRAETTHAPQVGLRRVSVVGGRPRLTSLGRSGSNPTLMWAFRVGLPLPLAELGIDVAAANAVLNLKEQLLSRISSSTAFRRLRQLLAQIARIAELYCTKSSPHEMMSRSSATDVHVHGGESTEPLALPSCALPSADQSPAAYAAYTCDPASLGDARPEAVNAEVSDEPVASAPPATSASPLRRHAGRVLAFLVRLFGLARRFVPSFTGGMQTANVDLFFFRKQCWSMSATLTVPLLAADLNTIVIPGLPGTSLSYAKLATFDISQALVALLDGMERGAHGLAGMAAGLRHAMEAEANPATDIGDHEDGSALAAPREGDTVDAHHISATTEPEPGEPLEVEHVDLQPLVSDPTRDVERNSPDTDSQPPVEPEVNPRVRP